MSLNNSIIGAIAEHADFYFVPDTAVFGLIADRIAEDFGLDAAGVKSLLLVSCAAANMKPRDFLGCFAAAYTQEIKLTKAQEGA